MFFVGVASRWCRDQRNLCLQDWNLTWNADVPDFTECFHRTVLVWVPCAALWLMAPFEVYWLLHSRRGPVPLSPVNVVKMIVTSLLVSLSLISLFPYLAAQQGATVADASCVSAAVLTATFVSQHESVCCVHLLLELCDSFCPADAGPRLHLGRQTQRGPVVGPDIPVLVPAHHQLEHHPLPPDTRHQ